VAPTSWRTFGETDDQTAKAKAKAKAKAEAQAQAEAEAEAQAQAQAEAEAEAKAPVAAAIASPRSETAPRQGMPSDQSRQPCRLSFRSFRSLSLGTSLPPWT
jgi:sRNA-binding protein